MANNYFVFHTRRDPRAEENLYPLEGSGYSLKIAKDYARIASAHGDPTEVYRGKPKLDAKGRKVKSGKRVRRYENGKRAFPFVPDDLAKPLKLTKAEVPSTMKQYARAEGIRNPASVAVGTPQPTKTLQVTVHQINGEWVGDLQSKHKDMMYREMLSRAGQRDAFGGFALITFPRKPRMSAAQNRRLADEGEATVRMKTKRVEELIDATWEVDVFPWKHNPSFPDVAERAEELKDYEDELLDAMVETAWEDTVYTALGYASEDFDLEADDYGTLESLTAEVPEDRSEIEAEMRKFVKGFEQHHGGKKWYRIFAESTPADGSDIEYLGYYLYMQTVGHGVDWSDSREGEFDTPYNQANDTYGEAEGAIRDELEELGYDTSEWWG
jgi:hypothetical protein